MRTPERAVWPLPPRPPVLPTPEPIPRPMRTRFLRDPGRSAIWLSFMSQSLLIADHADEMLHFHEHAARRRIVGQFLDAADLVQPEPDQGLALGVMAPLRAADLLDLEGLRACHDRHSYSSLAGGFMKLNPPEPRCRRLCAALAGPRP